MTPKEKIARTRLQLQSHQPPRPQKATNRPGCNGVWRFLAGHGQYGFCGRNVQSSAGIEQCFGRRHGKLNALLPIRFQFIIFSWTRSPTVFMSVFRPRRRGGGYSQRGYPLYPLYTRLLLHRSCSPQNLWLSWRPYKLWGIQVN